MLQNSILSYTAVSDATSNHHQHLRSCSSSNLTVQRNVTPPKRPAMLSRKNSSGSSQNLLLKTSNPNQFPQVSNHLAPTHQINLISNKQLDDNSKLQHNNTNINQQTNTPQDLHHNNSNNNTNSKFTYNYNNCQKQQQQKISPCISGVEECQSTSSVNSFKSLEQFKDKSLSNNILKRQSIEADFMIPQRLQGITVPTSQITQQTMQQQQQKQYKADIAATLNEKSENNYQQYLNGIESNLSSIQQESVGEAQNYKNQNINCKMNNPSHRNEINTTVTPTSSAQNLTPQESQIRTGQGQNQIMIQMSNEIERLNAEIKIKSKNELALQQQCDQIKEAYQYELSKMQTIVQNQERALIAQKTQAQQDQILIGSLRNQIESVTQSANQEVAQQELSNNGMRERFDQLVRINEGLIARNTQFQERILEIEKTNMALVGQKQDFEDRIKLIDKANINLQQKNEQILQELTKAKGLLIAENDMAAQREEFAKENERLTWIIEEQAEAIVNLQQKYEGLNQKLSKQNNNILGVNKETNRQSKVQEEEFEGMKYLVKEKIQEIAFWRNKAEEIQKDYDEQEKRLQAQLRSNQTLNNQIQSLSIISGYDNSSKSSVSHSVEQENFDSQNQPQRLLREPQLPLHLAQSSKSSFKNLTGLSPKMAHSRKQPSASFPLKECKSIQPVSFPRK